MSISSALHKDGGDVHSLRPIIRHRFFSFLIWQSLLTSFLHFLSKTLLLSFFTPRPFSPSFLSLLSFLFFHLSLLLFSTSLFFLSSPRPRSPFYISISALSFSPVPTTQTSLSVSFAFLLLFLLTSALAAPLSLISLCWGYHLHHHTSPHWAYVLGNLGFRAFVIGFFYGLHYVYTQRWVLRFPIIQRPPFFSFKMGIPSSVTRALKFSAVGYFLSGMLAFFLPNDYRSQGSAGTYIFEQIIFYIGSFVVLLCWELNHHLHQVLHTKRFSFAPPKGSAAAETNPSEPLLATLGESTPKSLLQYLAYLDLCTISEKNVDTWRRAAIFEETGETYKRVIASCLRPLEEFTQKLAEGLESSAAENSMQLSDQLSFPTERLVVLKLREAFYDSQLCAWCSQTVASLTARSHKEDRYGVAQLTGSHAAVLSTLLSSLLAVEGLMGKKTNLQSTNLIGIKWATVNTGRRESTTDAMVKIRGSPIYGKAFYLADTLKTSIYCIVSSFHSEMLHSWKTGLVEKDWIISGKPVYGSRELLVHKLGLFLEFHVT